MTALQLRDVHFDLDADDIPFCWNPGNPAFSLQTNMISFMAIAFEKFIVAAVDEAMPLIRDEETRQEALSFLDQEAQHASWHRRHVRALTLRHPILVDVLSDAIASFDRLTTTKSLAYRLAFTADLEATFTPWFKMLLDNDRALFGGGDERVASLFLWHFVEEVEHRSSALTIYDAVVEDPWYRMRVAPSIFKHVMGIIRIASEDFNKHVPLADRKVDAMSTFRIHRRKKALLQRLPFVDAPFDGPFANAFNHLPLREQLVAMSGVVRSQIPGHDPTHEQLPALAQEWFDRYEAGYDVTQWYTADQDDERSAAHV